jgi:predicted RNase H-like HicB family nuclease
MRSVMKYLIVIEKGPKSYGAYVPDLPGCVAVGDSKPEVKRLIREAISLHLEAMRDNGETIPKPTAASDYVVAKVA